MNDRDPQTADPARLAELPDEERDDDRTSGGGVMSQGGTAVDRGTGTLDGTAQGGDDHVDDEVARDPDEDAPAIQVRTG